MVELNNHSAPHRSLDSNCSGKKKLTTKKEGMLCMMPPNRRPQDSVRIHESCHVAVAQLSWMDAGARWVPSRSWLGTSTHTRTRPSIRGIFRVEQTQGQGCVLFEGLAALHADSTPHATPLRRFQGPRARLPAIVSALVLTPWGGDGGRVPARADLVKTGEKHRTVLARLFPRGGIFDFLVMMNVGSPAPHDMLTD